MHQKGELHSGFMSIFCLVEPLGRNLTYVCSVNKLSTSFLAFMVP